MNPNGKPQMKTMWNYILSIFLMIATVLSGNSADITPDLTSSRKPDSPAFPPGLTIMPMGDSITYGDHGRDAGYRGPLYQMLKPVAPGFRYVGSLTTIQANISLPATYLHHEGHSGWTAAKLTKGNYLAPGNGVNPDVILLQIGTNDLLSYGGGYTDNLRTDLELLITQLTTNRPKATIIIAHIPPSTKRKGVTDYNAMVDRVAAKFKATGKHLTVLDNYTGFPANGSADGTHPNDIGYRWLAGNWFSALSTLYSSGVSRNP